MITFALPATGLAKGCGMVQLATNARELAAGLNSTGMTTTCNFDFCKYQNKQKRGFMELTQSYLKELFDYHPDGYLIWKVKKAKKIKVGSIAGCVHKPTGYARVQLNSKLYQAHRLIFLWHYGYFPKCIDHINRIKIDNRHENLRDATFLVNVLNRNPNTKKLSKYKGVTKQGDGWQVYVDGKYVGFFKSETDAALAYDEKVMQVFGGLAPTNKELGLI